jgi:hypothetical protein
VKAKKGEGARVLVALYQQTRWGRKLLFFYDTFAKCLRAICGVYFIAAIPRAKQHRMSEERKLSPMEFFLSVRSQPLCMCVFFWLRGLRSRSQQKFKEFFSHAKRSERKQHNPSARCLIVKFIFILKSTKHGQRKALIQLFGHYTF